MEGPTFGWPPLPMVVPLMHPPLEAPQSSGPPWLWASGSCSLPSVLPRGSDAQLGLSSLVAQWLGRGGGWGVGGGAERGGQELSHGLRLRRAGLYLLQG